MGIAVVAEGEEGMSMKLMLNLHRNLMKMMKMMSTQCTVVDHVAGAVMVVEEADL